MVFDDWSPWKRAATLNIIGVAGLAIGFASTDVRLSPSLDVPIAVFTLAGINFLVLVVRPQLVGDRALGYPGHALQVLIRVVRQRPLILLLVIIQLIGVSQLLTVAAILGQVLIGGRIHALPNGSSINLRMVFVSVLVLTATAALWLLSAIGLWRSRSWAWWLALFLNALVVVTTIGVGLLAVFVLKHRFLFGWQAALSVIACALLLLPVVRNDVRPRRSV